MDGLIEVDASFVTDKGLIRLNNEDNFYLNGSYMLEGEMNNGIRLSIQGRNKEFVYAVCDGIRLIKQGHILCTAG